MAVDLLETTSAPSSAPTGRASSRRADEGSGRESRAGAGPAVGRVASTAALLVALFAAIVLIVLPVVTGSQTYTVLTNSMAPKFPPGTFLVIKPTPFDELKYGDVVTFQLYSGRPDVETHRIVGFGSTQAGEKTLITRGDNNGANDADPVREIQVQGKLFYAVPYVGYVANALGNADRGMWTNVVAFGLFSYGGILVLKSVRKSRPRGTPQEAP